MRVGQPLVDQLGVRVARRRFDRTRPRPGAPGATGSPAQERTGRDGSTGPTAKRWLLDAPPDGGPPGRGTPPTPDRAERRPPRDQPRPGTETANSAAPSPPAPMRPFGIRASI